MKAKELLEKLQKLSPEELEYPVGYWRYNFSLGKSIFNEYHSVVTEYGTDIGDNKTIRSVGIFIDKEEDSNDLYLQHNQSRRISMIWNIIGIIMTVISIFYMGMTHHRLRVSRCIRKDLDEAMKIEDKLGLLYLIQRINNL